jgi:hypothetical protein
VEEGWDFEGGRAIALENFLGFYDSRTWIKYVFNDKDVMPSDLILLHINLDLNNRRLNQCKEISGEIPQLSFELISEFFE